KFLGKVLRNGEKAQAGEPTWPYAGKTYRRLRVGDVVEKDDLLGLVEDVLARAELAIKDAKVASADADKIASEKTRDETKKKWETAERLYKQGAMSIEDVRMAELTYYRYLYEAKSKV